MIGSQVLENDDHMLSSWLSPPSTNQQPLEWSLLTYLGLISCQVRGQDTLWLLVPNISKPAIPRVADVSTGKNSFFRRRDLIVNVPACYTRSADIPKFTSIPRTAYISMGINLLQEWSMSLVADLPTYYSRIVCVSRLTTIPTAAKMPKSINFMWERKKVCSLTKEAEHSQRNQHEDTCRALTTAAAPTTKSTSPAGHWQSTWRNS